MPIPQAIVTARDRRRLEEMIRSQRRVGDPFRPYLDALLRRLRDATIVDDADLDDQVATMHSRLRIRDVAGGRSQWVTLVYPEETNPLSGRLSVLTNLGTALLGAQAGERVRWRAHRGEVTSLLEEVVNRPVTETSPALELVKG